MLSRLSNPAQVILPPCRGGSLSFAAIIASIAGGAPAQAPSPRNLFSPRGLRSRAQAAGEGEAAGHDKPSGGSRPGTPMDPRERLRAAATRALSGEPESQAWMDQASCLEDWGPQLSTLWESAWSLITDLTVDENVRYLVVLMLKKAVQIRWAAGIWPPTTLTYLQVGRRCPYCNIYCRLPSGRLPEFNPASAAIWWGPGRHVSSAHHTGDAAGPAPAALLASAAAAGVGSCAHGAVRRQRRRAALP